MMTTRTTTEIIEAYGNRFGQWVRISEIAERTGLTAEELTEAVTELLAGEGFWAEPEPFAHRAGGLALMIGGEPRHLIRFEL